MVYAKARLAEAYTCTSSCSSKITDEGFGYSVRGEVAAVYESTPNSGGYYVATASYWANGLLNGLGAATGYATNYTPDGEGRVYSAGGGEELTSTAYNSASKPTAVTFASGDSDSFTYDPNTFRTTQYQFNVNSSLVTGKLTWNANGSLASLDITDAFNSANTQNCAYTHDDLGRIASANCGSVWSQTFSYDAFGNLTKAGTNSFNPGYNSQTNQMSSGATYDANGDVVTDSLHSYAWDVEGRPTTIDGITVTYDAQERMAEQNRSGSYTQIQYAPTGFKMQLMNGQSYAKAWVPMPGGTAEVWQTSGTSPYYQHADWLGSSRFASTTTRTMLSDQAYAPFGEPYAQSGSADLSFTGMNQDTTVNLYDFPAREYGIQGRWPSPDPTGLSAAHLKNPQTLNRYAYVAGRPLKTTDPLGTDDISGDDAFDVGTTDCDDDVNCWVNGPGGDGDADFDFADYDSDDDDNFDTPVCNDANGNIISCPTDPDCNPTDLSCVGALPIDPNVQAQDAAALEQLDPFFEHWEGSIGVLENTAVLTLGGIMSLGIGGGMIGGGALVVTGTCADVPLDLITCGPGIFAGGTLVTGGGFLVYHSPVFFSAAWNYFWEHF